MNLETLVSLCHSYARMGGSVINQLQDVVAGHDFDEQNPNALDMIADWLKEAASEGVEGAEELAESIDEYLMENK